MPTSKLVLQNRMSKKPRVSALPGGAARYDRYGPKSKTQLYMSLGADPQPVQVNSSGNGLVITHTLYLCLMRRERSYEST